MLDLELIENAEAEGKSIFFHGTSADAVESILKNGILPDQDSNWLDSEAGHVYMWCPRRLAESEGNEDGGLEDKMGYAFQRAAENAEFSLAHAKDCRRVVLAIALPDGAVSDDTSSEHMYGAVCHGGKIPPSAIVSAHVDNESLEPMRWFFLASTIGHESAKQRDWTSLERKVATVLAKVESSGELQDILGEMTYEMQSLPLPEPAIESLSKGGAVKGKTRSRGRELAAR